jgi:pimeloyl-ACP methyl ester carboxylesterase
MTHKKITGDFGAVHYWIEGQGQNCIVFTHGATMDHGLFQYQVENFSQQNKVINWDVPMHGRSRPYDDFSLQKAASELIRILDVEQIGKVHLVGQSMGGYISQYVARDYPERIISLTAVDSSPLQPSYYSAIDNWLLSITPTLLRLYPYNSLIKIIAQQIAIQEAARSYALETLQSYTKNEIVQVMDIIYQGVQAYRRESTLPVPILIVIGDSDRTGKVQAYSKQWAAREKRPLQVIPNASHNANMDNPMEFNRILAAFLEKIK